MELVKANLADRQQQFEQFLEHASQLKIPEIRRMMISASLVQLYSAVESTMVLILKEVARKAIARQPVELAQGLRREWLRTIAATHKELNAGHRLDHLEKVVDAIVLGKLVDDFIIEKGGGGNWTDKTIEDICGRLGIRLDVHPSILTKVKRPVRDGLGLLEFLKSRRNELSHGSLSFSEASENLTCESINEMGNTSFEYLSNVVRCSQTFLETSAFVKVAS